MPVSLEEWEWDPWLDEEWEDEDEWVDEEEWEEEEW